MADDNRYYRSDDSYTRGASAADPREPPVSDPLAELARLIGQKDPFADLRRQARAAQQDQQQSRDDRGEWNGSDDGHNYPSRSAHAPAASYYAETRETTHVRDEYATRAGDHYS